MKRFHSFKDIRKRKQRERVAKSHGLDFLLEKNNMNKKHPLDCGRKRCHVCHYEKLLKQKTRKDIMEEERFKNMIYEQFDHNYRHDDWVDWINNFVEYE